MPILVAVLLLMLSCSTGLAQHSQVMTLADCMRLGMEQNPTLLAARQQADAAGQDVNAARADFLPTLTGSIGIDRIDSKYATGPTNSDYINQDISNASIKLTQILYAGSRLVNSHDRAKLLEQATQAERDLVELQIAYNIETSFYKVMKAKQDVLVASGAVKRLQESVRAAESFFAKELVPKVDLLSAQVDLADAHNQLGVAQNNENRQRDDLFALMNRPADAQIDFREEDAPAQKQHFAFDDCLQFAQTHRPDLLSLRLQQEAQQKQSDIALGKYLPVVQAEGGYYDQYRDYKELGSTGYSTYDRDQGNGYWMVGVTLNWNLFDGGRARYESEKSNLEGQRFGSLAQEARNTISTGIRKALFSMSEAEQRIHGSTVALQAAEENYSAEDDRLKAGVSTITALLDAQNRLVRAQVNLSTATLDYQLAQSELFFMMGSKKSW